MRSIMVQCSSSFLEFGGSWLVEETMGFRPSLDKCSAIVHALAGGQIPLRDIVNVRAKAPISVRDFERDDRRRLAEHLSSAGRKPCVPIEP